MSEDIDKCRLGCVCKDTPEYNTGWNEAIDMVLDVISEMQDSMNFDTPTLDELEQRIV